MKILLAEDDPNITTIARLALETIGQHEVVHAENGEIALQKASTQTFDLILLDEMMPKLNGLNVSKELKKANIAHPPIIFLSAKSQEADIIEFRRWGLGYIPKPFDPMDLCERIQKILLKAS